MASVRKCLLLLMLLVSRVSAANHADVADRSLFNQSATQFLHRDFPSSDISFLLLDAQTGALIASRWEHADQPIPVGSLVKPFAALAYGDEHEFQYPVHVCRGTSNGCWRPAGHGKTDLTSAIAYSCNSYFRALTAKMTGVDLMSISTRYGLQPPSASASGPDLIGLGGHWPISPLKLAQAYLELLHNRDQPGVSQIIAGMEQSGREGTGLEVDHSLAHTDALVKTGTAPCTHASRAPGDGFTLALLPATQPRLLLLVRVHGVPGSHAAKVAGKMLHGLEE